MGDDPNSPSIEREAHSINFGREMTCTGCASNFTSFVVLHDDLDVFVKDFDDSHSIERVCEIR